MIGTQSAVFSLVLVAGLEAALLSFPPDFKFGAASAAYQVEGAWNVSDKSPNIWDDFTHRRRDKIDGRGDGDVACDSYHQWRRDIEIAEELGLDFYRFSISWSRICPNGFCNRISEDGKAYYSRLIDGLLEKGIEPVVTLYHWDLPLRLQQLGGWANPLIIDWFAWYARVVYTLYADRVKTWITINEPLLVCDGVYTGAFSPMIDDPMVGVYLCTKNVLLAHAKAWRIYHEEFKPKYKGQASVSNHLIWYEPESSKERELTDLVMEQNAGRFSHAIFSKEGGWPPALERLIAENSKRQGYSRTRLPPFTRDEIELVKGTYDFYGLNFYTSRVVRHARPGEEIGSFPIMGSVELGAVLEAKPEWKKTTAWWLTLNAKGLRDQLVWLKQQYGDVPIVITENGVPSQGNQLDDNDRVQFFKEFLTQVLLAIKKDGVKVLGYTAWSLMDNFEWMDGYTHKFGLYEVNFTDPLRPRTPRSSARYYSHVISTHALDQSETGDLATWYAIVAVFLGVVAALAGFCYCNNKKKKVEYASVAPGEEMKLKTPYNQ